MKKLEIGSGNRPQEGFEHLDINPNCPHLEYIAAMDAIPIKDDIFDEVHAIHVIEHQSWRDAKKILSEWIRVTKPGGFVYIATPNLKFIAQKYLEGLNQNGSTKDWERDYNIMHPEEQAHIKIKENPNVSLWANFKIFSSTAKFDEHFACYDSHSLSKLLVESGASMIEVVHDDSSLVVKGYK